MPDKEPRPFREVRRRRMYSIRALAEKAGVSSRTIVDLEHGRTVPRLATMRVLCEALDIDPFMVEEFAEVLEDDTGGKEAA